ncbi:MAG: hypothetical protein C0434_02350 [Xanthomonadaceae bacterium]|nr:hypothetical protein [Xanthomonadaceae bacterium]
MSRGWQLRRLAGSLLVAIGCSGIGLTAAHAAKPVATTAGTPGFKVDTVSAPRRAGGGQNRFPKLAGNGNVARAINLFLYSTELQTQPGADGGAAFAALPRTTLGIDYQVVGNTARLLSIRIDTLAASRLRHPQGRGWTFDASSGRPVSQGELFSPEGYGRLRQRVATLRVQRIRTLQQTLGKDSDDENAVAETLAVYDDCLDAVRGDTLTDDALFVSADSLALEHGDCATADYLDYDILRPLRVEIPFTELAADLNDYGRCLLLGTGAAPCAGPVKDGPQPGSYAGTIGKRPVTVVFERRYDGDRISGSFVLDNRYHRLEGRSQRDGKAKLYETGASSDELICEFTLFGKPDGSLDGTWRSLADSQLQPLALKPLR